jgi:PKD repeat protein
MIPPLLRRLALAILLLCLALVAGASADPFEVATYADLCKVGTGADGWTLDADYVQTADIQCPAGANFTPIGEDDPFSGSYDGRGYVIRDLYIDMPGEDYVGLFGEAYDGSAFTNIVLENISIAGDSNVGGLVGLADCWGSGVTIENCTVSGIIICNYGYYIGGLVGCAIEAAISNCHADVEVEAGGTAVDEVGGLVGKSNGCVITSCSARGNVFPANRCGGGLIGRSDGSTVVDCRAHGDVGLGRTRTGNLGGLIGEVNGGPILNCSATGDVGGDWSVGGLIGAGSFYGPDGPPLVIMARCFATGNVSGESDVGGLVGYLESLAAGYTIEDCYARGEVVATVDSGFRYGGLIGDWWGESGPGTLRCCYSVGRVATGMSESVGGLIGKIYAADPAIVDCFWDTETSGLSISAGGATGKTTAEMQALATFANWSIATPAAYTDEVWYLVPGEDYPRLAWEGLPTLPPVAAFSAAPTSGIAPLTVQFTDASTNDPTAWSWNFGDGGTSDQQHPSHTYNEPGTYTVSLTATNAGGSDTKTKTGHITVTAPVLPPVAAFSAAPTTGTAPLTVQFTDESTGATLWSWNFGDGRTSIAQSPSHTYSTAGTYTVALTVTNAGGSDTETKNGYITVSAAPPTAPTEAAGSPAFPYSQQRKETLSFLLMCWGALAFVGVFCVVIFLLMNGAQRGSGGI